MYKHIPKSTQEPTASLLGRFSNADSWFRQSKHQFLKTHPSNQIEDLQNSIKETTNSREPAMALKASTHTHSCLLSHRIQHCATFSALARDPPCHPLSARPALMDAAGAGTCPFGRELRCVRHKGRKDLLLLPGRGISQSLGNGSESQVASTQVHGGLKFISKAHVTL